MTTTAALEQYQDRPEPILHFLDLEKDPRDIAQNRIEYLDRMEEKYQRKYHMTNQEARATAAARLVEWDIRAINANRDFSQRMIWPGAVTEALDAMHEAVFEPKPGSNNTHSPEIQNLLTQLQDDNPEGIASSYAVIADIQKAINDTGDQPEVEQNVWQAFNRLETLNLPEVIQQVQGIREQAEQTCHTILATIADRFLKQACNGFQDYLEWGGAHVLRPAKQNLRIGLTLMVMKRTQDAGGALTSPAHRMFTQPRNPGA